MTAAVLREAWKQPELEKLLLFVAPRLQRGVFEKFLAGTVDVTDEPVCIDRCRLDGRGKKRFAKYRDNADVETVIGIARFEWKSPEDRENCMGEQKAKNKRRTCGESRWTDILNIVDAIKQNVDLPLPALVHPTLHNNGGLRVIDGSRRFVAHVEAGKNEFRVAVIRAATPEP